ncbi:MAG: sulfotransferase [Flavobacteriales bacterium]|nr:sulfotransferase [Flavobacteriales bacterium]
MRVQNGLIGLLAKVGLAPAKMSANSITQKAMRKTGLTDLEDNMHRPGMEQLVKAINVRPVTHFGKLTNTGIGVEALSNRLLLIDYLKKNPHIRKRRIERPVFIIGFPRTGTTLLQNLLNLGSDMRGLPFWEISNPIPLADNPEKDIAKRHSSTKRRLKLVNFVVPEMKFIHEVRYNSLEECWPLMISQFAVPNRGMTTRWEEYGEWILQHDMTRAYEEYRKFLQVMAARTPDQRLILKCPDHLWHLDMILKLFPDACIVWTHRNPAKSISSYSSMVSLNWRLLYGKCVPEELGPYLEKFFKKGIDRALEVRDKVGDERFFDVDFDDLQKDPIAVVNGITDFFAIKKVDNVALKNYLDTDRPDNKGKHSYSAEHFGLDVEKVNARFRSYMERFNIS